LKFSLCTLLGVALPRREIVGGRRETEPRPRSVRHGERARTSCKLVSAGGGKLDKGGVSQPTNEGLEEANNGYRNESQQIWLLSRYALAH